MDEEHYHKIITLLREAAQKGLTIEQISKKVNLSRTTTAIYLNSLFASGQVNMRKVGPAKLFTLSIRLPADQILTHSPDPVLLLDESYVVRDVSDSLLRTFGLGRDELIKKDITTTAIGRDLIDRISDPVKQGLKGTESALNTWIPAQNERRAFRIRVIPLVFGWGEKGVVIMFEDRTAEVRAHEENALLADLVNASPAAIIVHDLEGNVLYANKKALDLHGYTLSEFLKKNLKQLNTPDSAARIAGHMQELKHNGEATFEVVHLGKEGRQIPLEIQGKVTKWGGRDVIFSIASEISERKRTERALKASERRLADIIRYLPDATFVIDTEGRVLAWNNAMRKLTGVSAELMVGKGNYEYAFPFYHEGRPMLADLVLHEDPAAMAKYPAIKKEGNALVSEGFIPHFNKGKGAHLWFTASPLYDTNGNLIGAIETIRDITGWQQTR